MTNDFWIPISFGSEETEEKIVRAITSCWQIHVFTLETLNDYFIDHAEPYLYRNFRKELNLFLRDAEENFHAQRYSLVRAAEKTFPYFSENKKFKGKKFIQVKPIPAENYREITVPTRQVWKKYLALNGLITTVYGTIFLADCWIEVLESQALKNKISFDMIPYLWHSVTIHLSQERQEIKFNLHDQFSKFGKVVKNRTEDAT